MITEAVWIWPGSVVWLVLVVVWLDSYTISKVSLSLKKLSQFCAFYTLNFLIPPEWSLLWTEATCMSKHPMAQRGLAQSQLQFSKSGTKLEVLSPAGAELTPAEPWVQLHCTSQPALSIPAMWNMDKRPQLCGPEGINMLQKGILALMWHQPSWLTSQQTIQMPWHQVALYHIACNFH